MTLAARLKQLRLEQGLTQEQLGDIVGLKKQAIWKYENGNVTNMKSSTIKTLANYFDVSPSYLLGYTDVRKESTAENVSPDKLELTEGERMLLDLFNQIPEDKQQLAIEMIRAALKANE